ncbi:MAG: hypothetical protein KKD66_05355, partial [Proteobacteria bacterium]|nr:hypothetical protein [Pseudomonadota bacterium]
MGFLSKILGYFQSGKKTILSQEDIKALGFFDNMSYPYEDSYRENGKKFVKQYGPLLRVEYLSHYPKFEINFVFNKFIVYSGSRGNSYDINFLSLGYIGEGPRYSKYFLEGVGFILSDNEIKNIKPGAVIEKIESTVTVNYPENPEIQKAQTSEIYKTELFDAIDEENINKVNELLHHYSLDLDKLNDDY